MNKIIYILFFIFSLNINYSKNLNIYFSKQEIGLPEFESPIKAVEFDNYSRIWLGSEKNILVRKTKYKGTRTEPEKCTEITIEDITDIKKDSSGYIWATTKNGIYVDLKIKNKILNTINSPIPDNNVTSIEIDSKKQKWFGTTSGIAMYNDSNWTIYNKSNCDFPSDSILDIAIDNKNILWAVTPYCLMKFDGSDWDFYEEKDCNILSETTCMLIDSSGKIYIGSKKGLMVYFDNEWICYNKDNSKLPDNWITCLSCDKTNRIFIGTKKGLAILDSNEWIDYNEFNANNFIQEIYFITNKVIDYPFFSDITICTKDGVFYYNLENYDYFKCFELIHDIIQNREIFLELCRNFDLVTPHFCNFRSKYMDISALWIFTIKYFKSGYHVCFDNKSYRIRNKKEEILFHHIKLLSDNGKKLFIDFLLIDNKWLLNSLSDHTSLMQGNNEADE